MQERCSLENQGYSRLNRKSYEPDYHQHMKDVFIKQKGRALHLLDQARIVITSQEADHMEVTDLGIGDLENVGLQVILYENNDRYCAKELILTPWQICPEHRHPPVSGQNPGKMETFRCRWGEVYLYVEGERRKAKGERDVCQAKVPETYLPYLNVWHEIVLKPGDQYTIPIDGLHWFQAGPKGAVVSEFSSTSTDENDVFTDPRVERVG